MNYEILVGEPWDFKGPDGENRILVSGVGTIHVADNQNRIWESYLLKVSHPFEMNQQKVEFMIIQPRHASDTITQIVSIGGAVGVYRVIDGVTVQKGQQISLADLTYCIIGSLNIVSK